MPIDEVLTLLAAALAGTAIGGAFFGALWWTVQRAVCADRPALWHGLSSLLRMAMAVLGFYWVGGGSWQRLLACLVGFLIGRAVVVLLTRREPGRRPVTQEEGHAAKP